MECSDTIKNHWSGHCYVHPDPALIQKGLFLQLLGGLLADSPQLLAFSGNCLQVKRVTYPKGYTHFQGSACIQYPVNARVKRFSLLDRIGDNSRKLFQIQNSLLLHYSPNSLFIQSCFVSFLQQVLIPRALSNTLLPNLESDFWEIQFTVIKLKDIN